MNIPTAIGSSDVSTTEKEQFWKDHANRQRGSGLSMVAYCRKYQISYDQFGYWKKKWRQQTAVSELLPVHLNRMPKIMDCPRPDALCTVAFKNGHELKIYDKGALSLLLSVWS